MAALPQLSLHEVPVPAHVTATMDQRECGHSLSTSPDHPQRSNRTSWRVRLLIDA
jgi:hypothetical protein